MALIVWSATGCIIKERLPEADLSERSGDVAPPLESDRPAQIIAVTQEGNLVMVDSETEEVREIISSGTLGRIVTPPKRAGQRTGLIVTDNSEDGGPYRLIILDSTGRVIANHQPPRNRLSCLNLIGGSELTPLDPEGRRFYVGCYGLFRPTYSVVFGDELQMAPLPGDADYIADYIGKPVGSRREYLPLMKFLTGEIVIHLMEITTGVVTETRRVPAPLIRAPSLSQLPQDEAGVIYLAYTLRDEPGDEMMALLGLDVVRGTIEYSTEVEVRGELEVKELKLLNHHLFLRTGDGAILVDTTTDQVKRFEDERLTHISVAPDASRALSIFDDRLESWRATPQMSEDVFFTEQSEAWAGFVGDCEPLVEGIRFSNRGESALVYTSQLFNLSLMCDEPEYRDDQLNRLGRGVIFTMNPLNPQVSLQDLNFFSPHYDPEGGRLAYFSGASECSALRLVDIDQASTRTLVPDLCFQPMQDAYWIR